MGRFPLKVVQLHAEKLCRAGHRLNPFLIVHVGRMQSLGRYLLNTQETAASLRFLSLELSPRLFHRLQRAPSAVTEYSGEAERHSGISARPSTRFARRS